MDDSGGRWWRSVLYRSTFFPTRGVTGGIAVGIFVLALAIRIGAWGVKGTVTSSDLVWFQSVCDGWLTSPLAAFRTERLVYSGFALPLCIVLALTGGSLQAWVAVQIVLSALSCVLVYYTGTRLVERTAGVIAGLSLAVLWDSFHWVLYVLSDTMFVFAVALALWALTRHHREPSPRNRALAWVSLGLVAVTRPFGLPIVVGWLAYDLLPRDHEYRLGLLPNPLVTAVLGAAGLAVVVSSKAYLLSERIYTLWSHGVVIWGDPTFNYHFAARTGSSLVEFLLLNADHMVVLAALKVAVFFLPFVPRFSTSHVLLNLALVPLTVGGFVGAVRSIRRRSPHFRIWGTPAVMVLLIVAVTYVDFGWRYRAPLGPVFVLLTAYAVVTDNRFPADWRDPFARIGRER